MSVGVNHVSSILRGREFYSTRARAGAQFPLDVGDAETLNTVRGLRTSHDLFLTCFWPSSQIESDATQSIRY